MMGISQDRKDLDFTQTEICDVCESYGRLCVFVTYTVLTLFFIPLWKWNRRYYVQTSCCQSIYELNEETGRRIENGENVKITKEDLILIKKGQTGTSYKKCFNCGYETAEDFEFCPKCGNRFN